MPRTRSRAGQKKTASLRPLYCLGLIFVFLLAGCASPHPAKVVLPEQATVQPQDAPLPTAAPLSPPTAAGEQTAFEGPLSVRIYSPLDGDTVAASPVVIHGEADPGTIVTLDDTVVLVDAGRAFSATVALEPGANLIEITASDTAGKQGFAYLTVTLDE